LEDFKEGEGNELNFEDENDNFDFGV